MREVLRLPLDAARRGGRALVGRARQRALGGEASLAAGERELVEHDRAVGEARAQPAVLADARRTAAGRSAARRRSACPSSTGCASVPRPEIATCACPSITASVPSQGCSGRSDASSAVSVAVNGASVAMRPGVAAGREREARIGRARARRPELRRRRERVVGEARRQLEHADAERELGRIERRALGAVPVAAFAMDVEGAVQARRGGQRPFAADHQRRREGQRRSREPRRALTGTPVNEPCVARRPSSKARLAMSTRPSAIATWASPTSTRSRAIVDRWRGRRACSA